MSFVYIPVSNMLTHSILPQNKNWSISKLFFPFFFGNFCRFLFFVCWIFLVTLHKIRKHIVKIGTDKYGEYKNLWIQIFCIQAGSSTFPCVYFTHFRSSKKNVENTYKENGKSDTFHQLLLLTAIWKKEPKKKLLRN